MACYHRWRDELARGDGLLLVEFNLTRYWLEDSPPLRLTAVYLACGDSFRVTVTDQLLTADGLEPREQYSRWIKRHHLVDIDPRVPMELLPEQIPKPWGGEIWYTAIERRGVCSVASGTARMPLPWLQAVLPGSGSKDDTMQAPVLLKVLESSPTPVLGDLYFELHEQKREVYVVTRIDSDAWPDGVAYIRYGFKQRRLDDFADDAQFRAAYLEAVQAYERVRRRLDSLPEGVAPAPEELARENELRAAMDDFTSMQPLRVGDVLEVPLRVPHALQHGIRVIEIQTPCFERKILSFAQQVLTQDHWDTREAVAQMRLKPPAVKPAICLHQAAGVAVERLAHLAEFEVHRVSLQAGYGWHARPQASYAVLIVVDGLLGAAGRVLGKEQALLLPRNWAGQFRAGPGGQPVVFLLIIPHS